MVPSVELLLFVPLGMCCVLVVTENLEVIQLVLNVPEGVIYIIFFNLLIDFAQGSLSVAASACLLSPALLISTGFKDLNGLRVQEIQSLISSRGYITVVGVMRVFTHFNEHRCAV